MSRVFLIVLDGFGVGAMPDIDSLADYGASTINSIKSSKYFKIPNLLKLGLGNIMGVNIEGTPTTPIGTYCKAAEASKAKDTITGHWEMSGIISKQPFRTFPNGFPRRIINKFEKATGTKTLCNKPYSGTEVIKDYGEQSIKDKKLIVYTSGDSVFQIAAHDSVVSTKQLYRYCEIAREILVGKDIVGRVIARPFTGEYPFIRTNKRKDYSVLPPSDTMLDVISDAGKDVVGVGKIEDIFSGRGLTKSYHTTTNKAGITQLKKLQKTNFDGLCFVNLCDFDMLYGHRRDVDGYAKALSDFDSALGDFINGMRKDDLIIITGDHGCDPGYTRTTDHTREFVPILVYGPTMSLQYDAGLRGSFCDVSATILDHLELDNSLSGVSILPLRKDLKYI